MRRLAVGRVLQAVLTVLMDEESRVHGRSARAARGDGGIGLGETHTSLGQAVEVRRADRRVAVAAQVEAEVVGDDKQNIAGLLLRVQGRGKKAEGEESGEQEAAGHGLTSRSQR